MGNSPEYKRRENIWLLKQIIAVVVVLLALIGIGLVVGDQGSNNAPPGFSGDTLPPSAP